MQKKETKMINFGIENGAKMDHGRQFLDHPDREASRTRKANEN